MSWRCSVSFFSLRGQGRSFMGGIDKLRVFTAFTNRKLRSGGRRANEIEVRKSG